MIQTSLGFNKTVAVEIAAVLLTFYDSLRFTLAHKPCNMKLFIQQYLRAALSAPVEVMPEVHTERIILL